MNPRWFFSQFYIDPVNKLTMPVCGAYGGQWMCPTFPADITTGWALVQMLTTPMQIAAAKQDTRVVVMPLTFDPAAVPAQVITAYASMGATAGMSMGALLAALAEVEPTYAKTFT